MADHIQNIGYKIVLSYQSYQNTEWQPLLSFLISQECEEHGKISPSYGAESELDAVTHWSDEGPLGCFLDFVAFQIVQTKISASARVFAVVVVLLILSFPPAIILEKFWISLPKRNSHSFECIRTILLCRQTFRLQLHAQKRQKDWDYEIQTKRSNHVEKTNCSCSS